MSVLIHPSIIYCIYRLNLCRVVGDWSLVRCGVHTVNGVFLPVSPLWIGRSSSSRSSSRSWSWSRSSWGRSSWGRSWSWGWSWGRSSWCRSCKKNIAALFSQLNGRSRIGQKGRIPWNSPLHHFHYCNRPSFDLQIWICKNKLKYHFKICEYSRICTRYVLY